MVVNKKNKYIALLLMLLVCVSLFAAGNENTIPPVTYKLYFKKPMKNTFYFSEPLNPTVMYAPVGENTNGGGVAFTLPEASSNISTASIGIYYKIEVPAKIEVWFNSAINHGDASRMKSLDETSPIPLSFLIGIGNDHTAALADLELVKKANASFDSKNVDAAATKPAYTVFCNNFEIPASFDKNLQRYDEDLDGVGTKVFCMHMQTNSSYMAAEYKGYIIMEVTTK